MPRVPTTAEQSGRNQIGGVGVATNVSTPFQNLQAPLLDGSARTLGQLAKSVQQVSTAVADFQLAESKRDLTRFDAAATVLRSRYEEQVKEAKGQARLDLIRGGAPIDAADEALPLQDQYTADLERLRQQFAGRFSADDELAVDMFSLKSRQQFQVFQNSQGNTAQDVVDAQMMDAKIATASKMAVDSLQYIWELGGESVKRRNAAYNSADAAVLDGDIGQAVKRGLDPNSSDPQIKAIVEGLVQKQRGVVTAAMVDSLLAEGKERKASDLIAFETGPDGHITDPAVISQLTAKLLPYREDMQAQKNYAALVKATPPGPSGTPSLASMARAIAAEPDRRKRAGLESQHAKYKAVISAERNEKIAVETQLALQAVAAQQRITPQMIPTIWLDNPIFAKMLTEGGGFANPQTSVDASSQANWEAPGSGGGRTFNRSVDIMMTNLQQSNPSEWLAVVEKGSLKGLINLAQDTGYRRQVAATRMKVDNVRSEQRVNLNQILTDIGVTQKLARTQTITTFGATLSAAVNSVRTPALNAGTKPAYNDIKAAVARELIKVRTDVGIFADTYNHAASTEVAALGGDPFDMRLDDTMENAEYIASALGVDTPVAAQAMASVIAEDRTLKGIAKHLNKALPADPASEVIQFDNTLHTLAVEQGLPSGFIEFLLHSGKKSDGSRYKRTPADLISVMQGWEKRLPKGLTKDAVMQIWMRSR